MRYPREVCPCHATIQYSALSSFRIPARLSPCQHGCDVNQEEVEDSKCRECVEEMNRLAEHERYRYLGHLSELERKHLPERLIKDRRTSRELHVECARLAPDWTTVEKANLQILEQRFASFLPELGYENYEIFLQMRDPQTHPLQKLNRSGVDELARGIRQFFTDPKSHSGDPDVGKFDLDDRRAYAPLGRIFQSLVVSKVDDASRLADGSTVVRVGVIAYSQSELEKRIDQVIANKLDRRADVLLIYSEGPLFLFDLADTIARLKQAAGTHQAQQRFGEIWFLAHYRTGGQKLFRIV